MHRTLKGQDLKPRQPGKMGKVPGGRETMEFRYTWLVYEIDENSLQNAELAFFLFCFAVHRKLQTEKKFLWAFLKGIQEKGILRPSALQLSHVFLSHPPSLPGSLENRWGRNLNKSSCSLLVMIRKCTEYIDIHIIKELIYKLFN